MTDEETPTERAGYYAAQLVDSLSEAGASNELMEQAEQVREGISELYNQEPQDEFRVGCFDAVYKGDVVEIQHDSMDEPLEVDFQEIHDLDDVVALLHLRSKVENNVEDAQEQFDNLVRNLEA